MTVCTVVRTVCTAVSMFSSEARLSCVRSYVRCEAMLRGEAAYGARRCCKATLRAVRGDAAGRSCVRCEHANYIRVNLKAKRYKHKTNWVVEDIGKYGYVEHEQRDGTLQSFRVKAEMQPKIIKRAAEWNMCKEKMWTQRDFSYSGFCDIRYHRQKSLHMMYALPPYLSKLSTRLDATAYVHMVPFSAQLKPTE